jgi:molecular chaperone DnaK
VTRATIDFGIDLGTTNSCIAHLQGTEVQVVRNNEGLETTPSAVWIDRKGRLHVGRRAREQFEADEANACLEFKLQMGKDAPKVFERGGKKMQPEEMSAEVLKSLVGDVRQRLGEQIGAAVITVPADFDLPQCDATRQAARMAGLQHSPLLQEPVAAALAYGFQSPQDRVFWMVYDLGGGTFDAAVIQMRDGQFRVVNHGGDRHLGGKLIDWAIVDQLLVPALTEQHPLLVDFARGNPHWRAAFAKLKLAAEQAKIRLSREESAEVSVEFPDGEGETVHFEIDLHRKDVEALIEPFIRRTVNICKRVLAEKRLGPGDVEKVLLVGGPTLAPYLRQRLADPADGLGIALEHGRDPMTVVAAGAAIFAATQRLPSAAVSAPVAVGTYSVQLEYQPIGAEADPLVGGKVLAAPGQSLAGFTLEFIDPDARPPRRSGKLPLNAGGAFMVNLWAEPGRVHTYRMELCDPQGRACPTSPDRLSYTMGNAPTDPPLTHSLGVAMANNEMDVLIPKGASLPARKRVVHRTAKLLRKGQADDVLRIPVVEGENTGRADRNRLIGTLEIGAAGLRMDVPAGSEIEITIDIDPSRLLRARAFIPVLDEEFEDVIKFNRGEPSAAQLRLEATVDLERLEAVRRRAATVGDARADAVLRRVDEEHMVQDLEAALAAAGADPDAADKAQNRLLDLKAAVDEAEDALEWPTLLAEAEEELRRLKELTAEQGTAPQRQAAQQLERETKQAAQARDVGLLRRKIKQIGAAAFSIRREQPGFWVAVLSHVEERRDDLRDPRQARQLFDRAERAMRENDLAALRAAVQQLLGLLPDEARQAAMGGFGGGTVR